MDSHKGFQGRPGPEGPKGPQRAQGPPGPQKGPFLTPFGGPGRPWEALGKTGFGTYVYARLKGALLDRSQTPFGPFWPGAHMGHPGPSGPARPQTGFVNPCEPPSNRALTGQAQSPFGQPGQRGSGPPKRGQIGSPALWRPLGGPPRACTVYIHCTAGLYSVYTLWDRGWGPCTVYIHCGRAPAPGEGHVHGFQPFWALWEALPEPVAYGT